MGQTKKAKSQVFGVIALFLAVLSVILSLFGVFNTPVNVNAGYVKEFNFQGRLTNPDGTNVADGVYDMIFKIYNVPSDGLVLWKEYHTGGNKVTVEDGVFNVNLGSINEINLNFNSGVYYLGIEVNGDGEMTPRRRIGGTGYSLNTERVYGVPGSLTDTNIDTFPEEERGILDALNYLNTTAIPAAGMWQDSGGSLSPKAGVSQNVSIPSGTLSVAGAVSFSSTLGVTGATTLSSSLGVSGATSLSSTLLVSGVTTLNNTLNANGTVNLGDGGDAIAISGTSVGITSNGANDITLLSGQGITFEDALITTPIPFSLVNNYAAFQLAFGNSSIVDALISLAGGGAGLWSVNAGVIHPTDLTQDLAIGANSLVAPFSVDESLNTVRIGEGSGGTATNAILNMYASNDSTGAITYTTNDLWEFSGGNIFANGGLVGIGSGANGMPTTGRSLNIYNAANDGYGIYTSMVGAGTNVRGNYISVASTATNNYGVHSVVSGATNQNYAGYFSSTLSATPEDAPIGVYVSTVSAGSELEEQTSLYATLAAGYTGGSNTYAIRGYNTAAGTGVNYGVYGQATTGSYPVGVFGLGSGSNLSNFGVFGRTNGALGDTSAVYGEDFGTSTGSHYGGNFISSGNTISGIKYGVLGHSKGTASFGYGVYGDAEDADIIYGGYFRAEDNDPTTAYGVYASASGTNNNNYGIYATASGGTANWAGYFVGNVALGNTATTPELRLYEAIGSGTNYTAFKATAQASDITYTLPSAVAGGSGYVLTGDATGALSWTAAGSLGVRWNEITAPNGDLTLAMSTHATTFNWDTTSGNAFTLTGNSLTSGSLLNLTAASTAAAGDTQKVLNIATSGANGTAGQTTYGLSASNTHTGTTSENVAGYFAASGGTAANYGIQSIVTGEAGNDYGLYVTNTSGDAGNNYGALLNVSGTAATNDYGIYSEVGGTASNQYGIYQTVTGGTSFNAGTYSVVSEGTFNIGSYAEVWGADENYGFSAYISPASDGTGYGGYFILDSSVGDPFYLYGVYTDVAGGLYVNEAFHGETTLADAPGSETYGAYLSTVVGASSNYQYGLHSVISGVPADEAGLSIAVYGRNITTGSDDIDSYGVQGIADSSGASSAYGVAGSGTGGYDNYGGYFTALDDGNDTNYGIWGEASGNVNVANYGIYSYAGGDAPIIEAFHGVAELSAESGVYGAYLETNADNIDGADYQTGFYSVIQGDNAGTGNFPYTYAVQGINTMRTGAGRVYAYGVYGAATGDTFVNYGIYGTASNGGTNWAGYFAGNVGLGGTATTPELRLYEATGSGTNYTAFKATAQAADITYTLPSAVAGGSGYVLTGDATGAMSWTAPGTLGVALSSITAATASNTINNATHAQEWQWNTIASGSAMKLSSTSTAGTGSASDYLLYISRSGANANATHTAYGLYSTVTNTGTTSTNYGIYATASGATTNYAGFFSETSNDGYGIYVNESGGGTNNFGIYSYSTATGTSNYGIYSYTSGATGGTTAFLGQDVGTSTGTHYGGYFTTSGNTGTGTKYAVRGDATGTATTNYGIYATASGATNNYAGVFDAGYVGIGDTTPDYKVDFYDRTSNNQYGAYFDFQSTYSAGDDQAAIYAVNSSTGGAADIVAGVIGAATGGGATAYNTGVFGLASTNTNQNIGVWGRAVNGNGGTWGGYFEVMDEASGDQYGLMSYIEAGNDGKVNRGIDSVINLGSETYTAWETDSAVSVSGVAIISGSADYATARPEVSAGDFTVSLENGYTLQRMANGGLISLRGTFYNTGTVSNASTVVGTVGQVSGDASGVYTGATTWVVGVRGAIHASDWSTPAPTYTGVSAIGVESQVWNTNATGTNYGFYGTVANAAANYGIYLNVTGGGGTDYGMKIDLAGTPEYGIYVGSGATTDELYVDGTANFTGNVDAESGLDVTGDLYVSSGLGVGVSQTTDGYIQANVAIGVATSPNANYAVYAYTTSTSGRAVYGSASATSGTNYGGYFSGAGAGEGATHYGVYATATGGTTNWAGYFNAGNVYIANSVGLNTTGPDSRLDILDASNPQLRLTYTDGTSYTTFQSNSSGDLVINPYAGDEIIFGTSSPSNPIALIPAENNVSGYSIGTSAARWKTGYFVDGIVTGASSTTYAESSITRTTGGGLNVVLGGAAGDDFTVNTDTFVVESDHDYVGINKAAPGYALDVADATANGRGINVAETGTGTTYGIYSSASGATTDYAGYFTASGTGTNYGIYATASGSSGDDDIAGYFTAANLDGKYVVHIINTENNSRSDVLALQLGYAALPGAANAFIQFLDFSGAHTGAVVGDGAGGVKYSTTGEDYAEYFPSASDWPAGTVVKIGSSGKLEQAIYGDQPLGVISSHPGFSGGQDIPGNRPLAMMGQVPVKITNEGGAIRPGDKVTVSSRTGFAKKVQAESDPILGVAVESFSGTEGQVKIFVSMLSGMLSATASTDGSLINGGLIEGDLGISGELDVAGTIKASSLWSQNATWHIDSLGEAVFQKVTAGDIEIIEGENKAIGRVILPGLQKEIFVPNNSVTSVSRIFLTIESANDASAGVKVKEKQPGQGFVISTIDGQIAPVDLPVDWLVIN